MMKAVLMAGGEGSRLRPLTVGRPKPMVPLVNKPVMRHILDLLKSHGITEVVITVRYMAAAIQDFFEDGSSLGMKLHYVVEEIPLGTAGSVKNAAHLLDEPFLVISGDSLTDFNLSKIIDAHTQSDATVTMTLARVPNPLEYGVIVTDEQGAVIQLLEKPGWGEVISDTVNTGIYVMEPSALALIPDDKPYDFAKQLFPRMMTEKLPVLGYVAEGYWCDIGTIEEYMRASADLLYNRVKLSDPIGTHIGGGIWTGEDVEISPSAQLFGPIYLGNGVKIKGDVTIHGPCVIRDYNIIDNYSHIERSIIWRNTYVGESCELRGTIVTRQCAIKSQTVAYEGVVIGDNCVLGEGSVLHPGVKLWPHKEIEAGATVKESVIWGSQGRRVLFNRFGVSGVVNIDLTPEFSAKLGAALGATLEMGNYVALNRDIHRSSRMLKRALISGLPGTGIHVWDLGTVAIPVVRHFVSSRDDTAAGIHVRLSPFDQRVVDIRFFDEQGINHSPTVERAVERHFFREDFRRAYLDEIGVIDYAPDPVRAYTQAFLKHVDVERIRQAGFKLVIDYSHGLAADTLADILTQVGVDVVPLNARMDESRLAVLEGKFKNNLVQAAKIVEALGADLGIQLDVGGEKMFVVDEKGTILDDVTTAALMTELALYANPSCSVAVTITVPNAFDTITQWHGSRPLWMSRNIHNLTQLCQDHDVLLAVDGTGNFVFPRFHLGIDGMLATVKLLEYLAIRQLPISEIVDYLPPVYTAEGRVHCPWESKGLVMRRLNETHQDLWVENMGGLKIHTNELEWVYLVPNPEKPRFDIWAEGTDEERAVQLVKTYQAMIVEFLA